MEKKGKGKEGVRMKKVKRKDWVIKMVNDEVYGEGRSKEGKRNEEMKKKKGKGGNETMEKNKEKRRERVGL